MIRQFINKYMGKDQASTDQDPLSASSSLGSDDDWDATDEASRAQLVESIYPQLKTIAEHHMRHERHDHALQPISRSLEWYPYKNANNGIHKKIPAIV